LFRLKTRHDICQLNKICIWLNLENQKHFKCKESKYIENMTIESIIARKSLGLLMHPTCIPGGRVCGTFGKGAKEWIKKLHKHGIEYWQFLPLTPTDSTGSPYSSPSSFALNPWFLDIDDLIEKGFIFISNKEILSPKNQNKDHFDFDIADDLTKN